MEIAFVIGAALLGGLVIYLAILGQEMSSAERRTRGWAEEPSRPAPESYRGKVVAVRFIKRDGGIRHMKNFIVLHVSRFKSGKILIHGLEATDRGWQNRGFCIDQMLAMKVVDTATERELREAYAVYRQQANPNLNK